MNPMPSDQYGRNVFFLGGTGRCGTNILTRVLAQHPLIGALPFEHRVFLDPDGIVDFYRSYPAAWSPYLADRKLKRLENFLRMLGKETVLDSMVGQVIKKIDPKGTRLTPRQYHGWRLESVVPNYRSLVDELMGSLAAFAYRGAWVGSESYEVGSKLYYLGMASAEQLKTPLSRFADRFFCNLMSSFDTEFFVDDNTFNILFAVELLELLPNSKVIHIYRDPRDVVTSMTRQRFAPSALLHAAEYYCDCMEKWWQVKSRIPKESYIEIKLEDLVLDPSSACESLCSFMGVLFDPVLLDVDLSKANSGRWRKDLTRSQQIELNARLARYVDHLQYDRSAHSKE